MSELCAGAERALSLINRNRYQIGEEHVIGFCGCVQSTLACPKRGSRVEPLPLRPAKE
jgi:hypothetical protein